LVDSDRACSSKGILINTNTLEAFKAKDKNGRLKALATDIYENIVMGKIEEDPLLFNSFIVFTYADLKRYQFYYWFAFLGLSIKAPYLLKSLGRLRDLWSVEEVRV
jgi:ubiquitin-like modifier-activating enzyme ATG7